MTETSGFIDPGGASRRQARLIRRMMILSLTLHTGVILLSPGFAFLRPSTALPQAIVVDLTDPLPPELPEEEPAPPAAPVSPKHAHPAAVVPAARRTPASRPPAHRWLAKLDAGLSQVPDAPVRIGAGKAGDLPVRRWTNDAPPRPGDPAPAVAPDGDALRERIQDLEARLRSSAGTGKVTGHDAAASMVSFGVEGTGDEPLPAWIRDMIRGKVRGYLSELQSAYSAALRQNPRLQGRLVVRFRIDPSGRVAAAEPVEGSMRDGAFTTSMLEVIRRWRFDPTPHSVEVLYPFLFVIPS